MIKWKQQNNFSSFSSTFFSLLNASLESILFNFKLLLSMLLNVSLRLQILWKRQKIFHWQCATISSYPIDNKILILHFDINVYNIILIWMTEANLTKFQHIWVMNRLRRIKTEDIVIWRLTTSEEEKLGKEGNWRFLVNYRESIKIIIGIFLLHSQSHTHLLSLKIIDFLIMMKIFVCMFLWLLLCGMKKRKINR
jgi:hypothetical protein